MIRYWWVNHKKTFAQESQGGYLWSPKTEKNLAFSQFYSNMELAQPGDLVLSFANAKIALVGKVSDYATTSSKPIEFAHIVNSWSVDGWLLPIKWHRLTKILAPKEFIETIRDHLPSKYSPIRSETGYGNQKAYLSEISSSLFHEVMDRAETNVNLLDFSRPFTHPI